MVNDLKLMLMISVISQHTSVPTSCLLSYKFHLLRHTNSIYYRLFLLSVILFVNVFVMFDAFILEMPRGKVN